ncbi:hypothetical protein P0F65_13930 [Sphingomonas sp. I4]
MLALGAQAAAAQTVSPPPSQAGAPARRTPTHRAPTIRPGRPPRRPVPRRRATRVTRSS